jgi:nucleoside diphosphate kinase
MGVVVDSILGAGVAIAQLKLVQLTNAAAAELLGVSPQDSQTQAFVGGACLCIETVGDRKTLSEVDNVRSNAIVLDDSSIDIVFSKALPSPAQFVPGKTTTCVIKPHAMSEGNTGKIIDTILREGYEITALQLFQLGQDVAAEFLEVYKGVVPEYSKMVQQLASGPCVAIELVADKDAVKSFRELCGPYEPEIAKHIRPKSLRARFGSSTINNAVHCTDLEDDGVLESEFFFRILNSA